MERVLADIDADDGNRAGEIFDTWRAPCLPVPPGQVCGWEEHGPHHPITVLSPGTLAPIQPVSVLVSDDFEGVAK